MKKSVRLACILIFFALCATVICSLHFFTEAEEDIVYIDWQSAERIEEDGTQTPFDFGELYSNMPSIQGTFRFTSQLPAGLENGSLEFETSDLAMSISLDGEAIYQSDISSPANAPGTSIARLPLPANTAGTLVLTCTIEEGANAFFPPLLRFVPQGTDQKLQIANTNYASIPAGATAAILLLVAGLFLLGIAHQRPEWSLIPLLAALTGLTFYRLIQKCGYYFLPEPVVAFFTQQAFAWLAPLALIVYLLMNRRREFWRSLGIAALWSSGALMAAYLISLTYGGYLSRYLPAMFTELFRYGIYDTPLHYFTLWLAVVCALLSAYRFLQSLAQQQTQARTLELNNRIVMDGYRAIERKLRENSALQHEFRHQISALDSLYQQKNFDQLEALLGQWKTQTEALTPAHFTDNFTVNAILQDAASRAAQAQTAFRAQVSLPKDLGIPENDLCRLLMNLLDNALEASEKVSDPKDRFIHFKAEIKQGFFTVKCENRYDGDLKEDAHGNLLTKKPDAQTHGMGMSQMSDVARKYHSVLDISRTDEHVFIVQTALKLPEKKK